MKPDKGADLQELKRLQKHIRELEKTNSRLEEKTAAMLNLLEDLENSKAQLKVSETQYRTLSEASPEMIYLIDAGGIVRHANKTAAKALRKNPGEIVGRSLRDLFPPEFAERHLRAVEQVIRTGEPLSSEVKGSFPNGYRWIDARLTPVRNDRGKIDGVLGLSQDISDRKRAERALRESEQKYRALIEATDTGYVVVDEQGRVVDANMNYVHLTGHLSLEEILNRPVTDWTATHDKERNRREVVKCLENGFVYDLEIDYLRRNGKIVPVEINAHVVKTEQGVRIITLCRDITKRRRELKTLQESEEKFRRMAEHLTDVLFTTDIGGVFTYISPSAQRIFGWSSERMTGRSFTDFLPEGEKSKAMEAFQQSLDSCQSINNLNLMFKRKTGGLFPGELNLSLIILNEGISSVVGLIRNIGERNRMEETLRENELKFRSFIEQSSEGFLLADNQGRIVEWNHALQKITGLKRDDAVGVHLWDMQHRITRSEHRTPNYFKKNKAEILNMLRTGQSPFGGHSVEVTIQRSDGELRHILQTIFTFYMNKETRIGSVFHDVTERMKTEEALRNSETRFRELLDSLPLIIFEYDLNANLTYANKRAFEAFGYLPEDLRKGFSILKGIAPRDRSRARSNIAKILAGKTISDKPYLALRRDGTTFPVQIHSVPIIVDDKVKGIRGALFDITELTNLRESILRLNRDLDRFERLATRQDKSILKLKAQLASLKKHAGEKTKLKHTNARNQRLRPKV